MSIISNAFLSGVKGVHSAQCVGNQLVSKTPLVRSCLRLLYRRGTSASIHLETPPFFFIQLSAVLSYNLQHLPENVDNLEIEERIIQHLAAAAAAAMGRTRHGIRREGHRSRSSPQGVHTQYMVYSQHPPPPMPSSPSQRDASDTVTNVPHSTTTIGEVSLQSNTVTNLSPSASDSNNRSLNQSSSSDQDRAGSSELQSFSESLKSRLNAVSTRYKESISKNTRNWKDRFFSRNTSISELGSEVKREVSAGIATVSRMMERLETRE